LRLLCPIGIDFNSVAVNPCIAKQMSKGHAVADAGIQRRELLGESQPILQPLDLDYRQRKKT
jgi:hypothetical protein